MRRTIALLAALSLALAALGTAPAAAGVSNEDGGGDCTVEDNANVAISALQINSLEASQDNVNRDSSSFVVQVNEGEVGQGNAEAGNDLECDRDREPT